MTEKKLRPSANKTREAILKSAKSLFLENGFDSTQIKDIAKLANVNTNLIFHHFINKETLWHKVCDHCIDKDIPKPDYDTSSGKAFFKSILDYRFDLYCNNPEFTKIIKWGSLASQEKYLVSQEYYSPMHWLPLIEKLQKEGFIHKNTSEKQIMLFIIFSSHAPFWQSVIPLNKGDTKNYKTMIFEMCCKQFLVHQ